MQDNIYDFLKNVKSKPRKERQKFVKTFVGEDRKLIENMFKSIETSTKEEIIKMWVCK